MKNRFKVGDSIEQYRYEDVIRKGTVVKGPFRVEGVDHYHIKWTWECTQHGIPEMFKTETDLICDLRSRQYRYELTI